MTPLILELRRSLEKTIIAARDAAEDACRAALSMMAVEANAPFVAMDKDERALRRALRAKMRQLGSFELLVSECAYEQWHRMLFARFLAENDLLMHPSGVPVTLQECRELAAEEGEPDEWMLAARYASAMLPGIFKKDDPCVKLRLAPEGRQALERILDSLPSETFRADDSLGWVYQFWQSKKKKAVNKSERKIGGADIATVTQLFTEHYMVQFLLENSLGAWWAARHPDSPLSKEFTYLRYTDDGKLAAGTFPGWPDHAKDITVMDPCCGSGHFLVAAFDMLRKMRMEEESLTEREAADAVIKDSLFGLEIDPRCTQIATFALALSTWKVGDYHDISIPNIACSGIPAKGKLADWRALAEGDYKLEQALERLYYLFKDADTLGSLIDPRRATEEEKLHKVDYEELAPLLEEALSREKDPEIAVFEATATEILRAAKLLAGQYALIATNVPYLGRGKQDDVLKEFCDEYYLYGKNDLATVFLERCREFTTPNGTFAIVSPQNWLFLASYKKLRERFLKERTWNTLARLGPGAFETIGGEVVNITLLVMTNRPCEPGQSFAGIDVANAETASEKSVQLVQSHLLFVDQNAQLKSPNFKIVLGKLDAGQPLAIFAQVLEGMHSGDYPRFGRKFWELSGINNGWTCQQAAPDSTIEYGGREHALFWEDGNGELIEYVRERLQSQTVSMWIKGQKAWGRNGVAVSTMSNLKATLYGGEIYTHGIVAIVPRKESYLAALWAFCKSDEFRQSVRKLDQKVAVARATFDQVPFDLEHWTKVAEEQYPNGLPEPHSNDPIQWLFKGNLVYSTAPLHVAVARLLGYRWPDQEPDELDEFVDHDGLVCLPAVGGEYPAADRLQELLFAF